MKYLALAAALAATPALAQEKEIDFEAELERAFDQAISVMVAVEPCQLRNDDARYANLGGNGPVENMFMDMGHMLGWDRDKVIEEYSARMVAGTQALIADFETGCNEARAFLASLDDDDVLTFSTVED